jgi:hypothetical protein
MDEILYLIHCEIDKTRTVVICKSFDDCPVMDGHILCRGVQHMSETLLDGASIEELSFEKTGIVYFSMVKQPLKKAAAKKRKKKPEAVNDD